MKKVGAAAGILLLARSMRSTAVIMLRVMTALNSSLPEFLRLRLRDIGERSSQFGDRGRFADEGTNAQVEVGVGGERLEEVAATGKIERRCGTRRRTTTRLGPTPTC